MAYRNEKLDEGSITSPQGYMASGVACGIKRSGKADLGLLFSKNVCTAVGVFTKNQLKGESLLVTRDSLQDGLAQAVVVNSGNANACTGERGRQDAQRMAELAANALNIAPQNVLPSSTGVIGEFLPMEKLANGIEQAVGELHEDGGQAMAKAIMTTDTFPKYSARRVEMDGRTFTLGGICKGAGMIHPNMATMLCYITTDAKVESLALRAFLKEAVDLSFNRFSIDGDTSCCDTVLLMANGQSGVQIEGGEDEASQAFREALRDLCLELVKMLARDGEGVTKVVTLNIQGAPTQNEAYTIAKSIAVSPLSKTALHGEDPNWGRFINAAGYSGAEFNPGQVDIWIGHVQVMKQGMRTDYEETEAHRVMQAEEFEIRLHLNQGEGEDFYITTDFSKAYVDINADYRNRT